VNTAEPTVLDMKGQISLFLLFLLVAPIASASIDVGEDGGDLWLSCHSLENCELTEVPIGEESIGDQVSTASPFSPTRVILEFPMFPAQDKVALIPDVIREIEIDLRYQDDVVGVSRPDLRLTLIIDDKTKVIDFEGDSNPLDGIDGPHRVEDEPLNLDGERLLWPGEVVKVLLEFELERPGNWELHLRGSSLVGLDIIWAEDMAGRDVDEPSTDASPRSTEFETNHYGALVEDDRDCWSFEIGEHEIMRVIFDWEGVPEEISQSHGQPDLILPDRRMAPSPAVQTTQDDDGTRIIWQWRALPTGTHTMCIGGKLDAFQPYNWAGMIAFEGIGPITPDDFTGEAVHVTNLSIVGSESNSEPLEASSGAMILILSMAMLLGLFFEMRLDTTSSSIRYGLFIPGVLVLLAGGIISPMWAMSGQAQDSDEMNLDELLDNRLNQLWHASHPSTPASTRALHVGTTMGMLDGETLQLRIEVDYALPLDDGRWQLHVPAIDEIELDRLIFTKLADKGSSTASGSNLDEHSKSFILTSGRSLMLDMIMLQALLVVDELPDSNIVHLDIEMVASPALGGVQNPAWATRPASITENQWRVMQDILTPVKMAVTILDDDIDALHILVEHDTFIPHSNLITVEGVNPVATLVPNQYMWVICGLGLAVGAIILESKRRRRAKDLLTDWFGENNWTD